MNIILKIRKVRGCVIFMDLVLWFVFNPRIHAEESAADRNIRARSLVRDARLIDVNNLECYIGNDGTLGENPVTGGAGFYYPAGQRNLSVLYSGGIWIVGKVNGEIRTAASCFGTEFQPGLSLTDGTADDPDDPEYCVYKYNKGDVVDQTAIDQGCPEEVIGDQMLFCVYNDLMSHSGLWGSQPIGIEVRQTTFAFSGPAPMEHMIFVKYRIVNKRQNTLDSAYIAMFFDPDLGQPNDDFTGCDTMLGIIFAYNNDGYDNYYGESVPCLGCGLLQGPLVDAPGESVLLPDGTVLQDKKKLGMTAYFYQFKHGGVFSGTGDIGKPVQAYNYVQGLRYDGEPWLDPTQNDQITTFPFAGDPVSGTGWLLSDEVPPRDIRMAFSSGPFTLQKGDSQEIVTGITVGNGSDPLSSVSLVKYFYPYARQLYESGFKIERIQAPSLEKDELDQEIILIWDDAGMDFDNFGYRFEGYNLWQTESEEGPWTRILTFDKENGLTTLWDSVFVGDIGSIINKPVQFGTDSGVEFYYPVRKDFIRDAPLINGTPYYFAVSSYAYRPDFYPRVVESARSVIRAVPGKPVMDRINRAEAGDIIPVLMTGPENPDKVEVSVAAPSRITGHTYAITFSKTEKDTLLWNLTDLTADSVKIAGRSVHNAVSLYEIVEGMLIHFRPGGQKLSLNLIENTFIIDTKEYAPLRSGDVARSRLDDISVYPNPYFGCNSLEKNSGVQFVTFINLPAECTIRIFSLSGQLVKTICHTNGTPLEKWSLLNDGEFKAGSGMYIVHVKTSWGDKILKLGIINRDASHQYQY